MFPVVQRWPLFPPLGANPPSAVANRRIHSSLAFAIRGSAFVSPRSDRISSIQFVERYFGRYRLSSLTHQPPRFCWAISSAAHPFSGMSSFAAWTSGAPSDFPTSCVRASDRTEGCSSSNNQSKTFCALTGCFPVTFHSFLQFHLSHARSSESLRPATASMTERPFSCETSYGHVSRTPARRSMARRNKRQLGHGGPSVPGEEFRHKGGIPGESFRHRTVEADRKRTDERIHGRFHAEGERLIWRRRRQEGRCDLADEPHLGVSLALGDLDHALNSQEEDR